MREEVRAAGEIVSLAAPDITEEDVRAVAEVVRSGRLALGPKAREFEERLAAYVGVKHGVAVSSGTAALHLMVRALGIGRGDEVIVPSFTFAATVNVLLYEGARPVFADIDPETYCLDPEDAAARVTPRTKAILAVDVFGHPADWDALAAVASRYGLLLLDDSCEALGAAYKGRKVGSFGNAAAFAFYPNKQITTGEGGMLVTDDDRVAALCRSLRNQGRAETGSWLEHERLGYNYRMDEMSAALGISQLGRLEEFLAKRENVARLYAERLRDCAWVRLPVVKPYARVSWFVYVVLLARDLDRDAVIRALAEEGIPSRAYFPPVHLQPYVRELLGTREGELPVTEDVARRTLALPFHNNLTPEEVDRVAAALERAVSRCSP